MNKKYFLLLLLFSVPGCWRKQRVAHEPLCPAPVVQESCDYAQDYRDYVEDVPHKEGEEHLDLDETEEMRESEIDTDMSEAEKGVEISEEYKDESEQVPVEESKEEIKEDSDEFEYEDSEDEDFDVDEDDDMEGEEENLEAKEEKSKKTVAYQNSDYKFHPIYYNYNSKEVRPDQEVILSSNLATIKDLVNKGYKIILEGHSCRSAGTNEYNLKLSRWRAENVARYLQEHGVSKDSMVIIAHGNNKPLVEYGDKNDQAVNRRVEIMARKDYIS